ncbi:testican-2-like [Anolis sagrei]|uniref:testican-2-like n=1 Tax=Anolis sagrei TaxID=38937 RepID=UPI00352034D7
MRAPGCCSSCLVPALLLLLSLASADGEGKPGKEGESPGNFMEDEQWLSSISQYSGKIKHWNRFRDKALFLTNFGGKEFHSFTKKYSQLCGKAKDTSWKIYKVLAGKVYSGYP